MWSPNLACRRQVFRLAVHHAHLFTNTIKLGKPNIAIGYPGLIAMSWLGSTLLKPQAMSHDTDTDRLELSEVVWLLGLYPGAIPTSSLMLILSGMSPW